MPECTDQLLKKINLSGYPQRIISLVPSLTELLFDLGLDNEIIGVTDYCVFPEQKVRQRTKIGGPKNFDFSLIDRLKPDLIIGAKEEHTAERIEQLRQHFQVWICDIRTIDDALNVIRDLGSLVNRKKQAGQLIRQIETGLTKMTIQPLFKVAYLIWKDPYMVAGSETFIQAILASCGFVNIFAAKKRYPKIRLSELADAQVILLSSEPYSFQSADLDFFKETFRDLFIYLVDGKIFSWYGSHMKYVPDYAEDLRKNILHDLSLQTGPS